MYEELIKRLRDAAKMSEALAFLLPHSGGNATAKLYGEAADAIEELSKPRWIPVTERLPESGVHVLASCCVKYVGGGGRSYVCDAFYSQRFKEQRSTEYDDIELDYDEETDEYYLPEGWWEVIRNWAEYGFVGIEDFVTHWMPLPQPPRFGV